MTDPPIRAGIFIGVDKSGGLTVLQDAARGAKRMYEWALRQGMIVPGQAQLITDSGGRRVTFDDVYEAVDTIAHTTPAIDQLIVYFAGHGVNLNRNEHWLLSDAPVRANAAINVSGSVELARYSGIPHVVFISDACRVAPEGIQGQNMRGQDLFPNDSNSDRAKPVDQFFACALGRTAAEVRDPRAAALEYRALYTEVLEGALDGQVHGLLEAWDSADPARYVRPRRLADYLELEVPRRIRARRLQSLVNQSPDAIILEHNNWLAKLDAPKVRPDPVGVAPAAFSPGAGQAREETLGSVVDTLVRSASEGDQSAHTRILDDASQTPVRAAREMVHTLQNVAQQFGPDHFESQCGIKVRGAAILEATAPGRIVDRLSSELLRVEMEKDHSASIVVSFRNSLGAVVGTAVPVIAGFLAALTFDGTELIDISYEPSANHYRHFEYAAHASQVRSLRAIAAAASRHGRFRLQGENAAEVARQMQWMKGYDPTLAIYAAYAYHDQQQFGRLDEMYSFQRSDIGATFFDLALLSRHLVGKETSREMEVVPFTPMLAQGWALLGANRFRLHPALNGIERNLTESLWSLYDEQGIVKLRHALYSGTLL